jgi:hypothetical protein
LAHNRCSDKQRPRGQYGAAAAIAKSLCNCATVQLSFSFHRIENPQLIQNKYYDEN